MKCISIPECTQRLSHLTNLGGQHGQESEEGEEGEKGEVGSEEDCEEDPQGRQEEEVTSLLQELPAAKCRHVTRAPGRFASRSKFKSEGSGRRKRVSARHQVKRLDRISKEPALSNRSGRRNRFSSFGADNLKIRNFNRAKARSEIWS